MRALRDELKHLGARASGGGGAASQYCAVIEHAHLDHNGGPE
jgi:hypothetical protein